MRRPSRYDNVINLKLARFKAKAVAAWGRQGKKLFLCSSKVAIIVI